MLKQKIKNAGTFRPLFLNKEILYGLSDFRFGVEFVLFYQSIRKGTGQLTAPIAMGLTCLLRSHFPFRSFLPLYRFFIAYLFIKNDLLCYFSIIGGAFSNNIFAVLSPELCGFYFISVLSTILFKSMPQLLRSFAIIAKDGFDLAFSSLLQYLSLISDASATIFCVMVSPLYSSNASRTDSFKLILLTSFLK